MSGIIAKKLGMSQMVVADVGIVPVTYLVCTPNTVHQIKTKEKDGYETLVLGAEPLAKPKKTKKFKIMKEFKFPDTEMKVNDEVTVNIFAKDDLVTLTGVSKGKGFQGRVRLHNMKPIRATHGTKYGRHGSTGMRAMPGRVFKGMKMPGRMGSDTITLKHKQVLLVDEKRGLLAVKGPVPGAKDSIIFISKE
jgi:large subunit ribosomal protein L3